jgi:hypothetical protein
MAIFTVPILGTVIDYPYSAKEFMAAQERATIQHQNPTSVLMPIFRRKQAPQNRLLLSMPLHLKPP